MIEKFTKVNETKKEEKIKTKQFYKHLIWDGSRGRRLQQEEHVLTAVLVLQSEVVALFSHRVKGNRQMSVCHKNQKMRTKRFRTNILR